MTTTLTAPAPVFVDNDPNQITQDMIAWWQEKTDKTLQPAQLERLFINLIAYREGLWRQAANAAALQNLVRFSSGPMVDELGYLVKVIRLTAKSALCTAQFTLPSVQTVDEVIVAGTQFGNSSITFATDSDITIPAGQLTGSGLATCIQTGTTGNGWAVGQLNQLFDDLPIDGVIVSNLDETSGGAEDEEDPALQERIILAPEAYTTAGSIGAYQFWTKSVNQTIIDVQVMAPGNGEVRIYTLTKSGLPSDALCQLIQATCSADKVRPLTDTVFALPPTVVAYEVDAVITPLDDADEADVKARATTALNALIAKLSATLGNDVVPSQIVTALSVIGVYEVVLNGMPNVITLDNSEWAVCMAVNLTMAPAHDR